MICPEFFGCSGKLDFQSTRELVRRSGFDLAGDYSIGPDAVGMSIDRVGQCSNNLFRFAEIAISHACRDLEAGFFTPSDALICYEFGPDADEQAQVEIVRSVKTIADHRKVRIGKCHSVFVEGSTSLVICVLGSGYKTPARIPDSGIVWISHGLGAAKLLYMNEIGILSKPAAALKLMTESARADVFKNMPCVVADVSGHGLAGCLIDLAERSEVAIDVTISSAAALAEEVLSEDITIFENEWESFGDDIQADADARRLAALKETAGPLVVLTGHVIQHDQNSIAHAGWVRIGRYERGRPGVRIGWQK